MTADGAVPAEAADQFRVALDNNLDAVLRAAGGAPGDVVKVTVFLTDIADRAQINLLRIAYFGDRRPGSTLVEVSALVLPGLKVKIMAEAMAGDGAE